MSKPPVLRDARQTAEASTRPDRLAFKNADMDGSPVGQMLAVDKAEGIVTAVVSVTGTEDEVQDIIVPGAYKSTLARRRPKVCWAHSWERPVGRVLHIEELLPNDSRLPAQTKDGQPWPTEAGALVATMQFNMASEAGREAFEAVNFYSETGECEYSIGYQVPAGKSVRDKAGVRHIKALELYELSVVLFGAHTMTGTLSIKDAYRSVVEAKTEQPRRTAHDVLRAIQETKVVGASPGQVAPDYRTGVMVAVYPDPDAADRIVEAIEGPDDTTEREELHVTLAYLGDTNEVALSFDEIVTAVTSACAGERTLDGTIGGIGMFPADDEGNAPTWAPVDVPGLSLLRETIVDSLGDDTVRDEHGFTPHVTLGYNIGLIDPLPEIPVTFSTVKVVYGQQTADVDLGSVLPAEGKGYDPVLDGDPETAAVLAAVDDDWATITAEAKALTPGGRQGDDSPVGEPGGRQNWVDKAGGLPKYIRMVAHALIRKGMGESRAIATAVNTIKRWARGGNNVTPKVQAAAAAALAEWEAKKKGTSGKKGYDPMLEGGVKPQTAVKRYPRLPGSDEERRDALEAAVNEALHESGVEHGDSGPETRPTDCHVMIEATFPDRVIATRMKYGPVDERETFEIPYVEHDGIVLLGEPVPVELQMVAVSVDTGEPDDTPLGDVLPLAEDVQRVTYLLKHALAVTLETKAGRVLSGANEQQLRVAVGNLLAVLAAAGVRVEGTMDTPDDELPGRVVPNSRRRKHDTGTTGDMREEVDQRVDLTTTSPSATTKSVAPVVEATDLAATLAGLLD